MSASRARVPTPLIFRLLRGAGVVATVGVVVALTAGAAVARETPARVTSRPATTSAVVVHIATRAKFGRILVTVKGRALYVKSSGTCRGSCLTIWPPLLMPKGVTKPKGTTGLGTAVFTGGRRQVTYHKKRLYRFVSDSGKSVRGNRVGGFVVARVK